MAEGAHSASLFHRLALAAEQAGVYTTLAALARGGAAEACAGTVALIEATPVEPTHAFP